LRFTRRSVVGGMGAMAAAPLGFAAATEQEMSKLPFAATTPVSVARVGLKARNAKALADYYSAIVGLEQLSADGETITLGSKDRPLLVIEGDTSAKPDDSKSAGLFHTAFLLPSRADLGRWINFAAERQIQIDGASDHLVSEALYLTDPEGNGIEIYADRMPTEWKREGGQIAMATQRMDIAAVRGSVPVGDAGWKGAPENSIVGHVHLRVGDPVAAEDWWNKTLGFDTVAKYGAQAVFLSTGGYHHHVGANSWQSAGAGQRDSSSSGLAWVELRSSVAAEKASYEDPWGTQIRVVPDRAA
jgi:catechol 2,3-dioxygenase